MKKRTASHLVSRILKIQLPSQPKFNNNPVVESSVFAKPDDFLLQKRTKSFGEEDLDFSWRLSGEIIICVCFDVSIKQGRIIGNFFVTNFRILFIPTHKLKKVEYHEERKITPLTTQNTSSSSSKSVFVKKISFIKEIICSFESIYIPLTSILTYYGNDLNVRKDNERIVGELFFQSKLLTQLKIYIISKSRVLLRQKNCKPKEFLKLQHRIIFTTINIILKNGKISNLFAYKYRNKENKHYTEKEIKDGYGGFNLYDEYFRQGIVFVGKYSSKSKNWKKCDLNNHFNLCDSYPKELVFPACVSDSVLSRASEFRASERLPVLTWNHPKNSAILIRSAQPLTGLRRSRSKDDEFLIKSYRQICDSDVLHIVDCRPLKNIIANQFMGKGTEINKNYSNTKIHVIGIENIQVVHSSFYSLVRLLQEYNNESENEDSTTIFSALESSGWFKHLIKILRGGIKVVKILEFYKKPVLVHCSDGWDRTAQVCSIAQILLDPYYRTIKGFQILIEKDWISFGYKFKERSGLIHYKNTSNSIDDVSPIFYQFIECVLLIWMEFPTQFEFNTVFLKYFTQNIYSSMYGNFLNNTKKERNLLDIKNRTISIWSYFNKKREMFINKLYNKDNVFRVLIPSTNSYKIIHSFFSSSFIYHNNKFANLLQKRIGVLEEEVNKRENINEKLKIEMTKKEKTNEYLSSLNKELLEENDKKEEMNKSLNSLNDELVREVKKKDNINYTLKDEIKSKDEMNKTLSGLNKELGLEIIRNKDKNEELVVKISELEVLREEIMMEIEKKNEKIKEMKNRSLENFKKELQKENKK